MREIRDKIKSNHFFLIKVCLKLGEIAYKLILQENQR